MGDERPRARRNRLGANRVAEMLDVAAEVFLEKGYTAASTAAIAVRANASKSTFYKRFPSKQDLFLAVIERHTEKIFEEFLQLNTERPVGDALMAFGRDLLRVLLRQEQITLIRLILAEVGRHPELAHHYFRCGPLRAEKQLQKYLEEQIAVGRLRSDGAEMMARQFVSVVTGSPVRWYVMGLDPTPLDPATMEEHLQGCVELFLNPPNLALVESHPRHP